MQPPVTGLTVAGALERQLQPLILKASESWRYKMSKTEEKVVGAGAEMESSVPPRGRRGTMRGAVLYGPGDIRFEERTDAEDRRTDRRHHPDRGHLRVRVGPLAVSRPPADHGPTPMGHEYCGIVEEVGSAVKSVKPGQFVVGSFATSDNTCPNCRYGYQTVCVQAQRVHRRGRPGAVAARAAGGRDAGADAGRSARRPGPEPAATSDVLGTGWFAADAANVKPGTTVAVVGDGAVGLLGVLSAKQMGAERIIAMSRHEARQKLAREFGATDIVTERGDEGVARIKDTDRRARRGFGAGVRRHAGVDDAGDPLHPAGRVRRLRRRPARGGVERGGAVLRPRPPARRPRPGAPLPAPS